MVLYHVVSQLEMSGCPCLQMEQVEHLRIGPGPPGAPKTAHWDGTFWHPDIPWDGHGTFLKNSGKIPKSIDWLINFGGHMIQTPFIREAILNPPTAHRRCAIRRSRDLRVGSKRTWRRWESVALICSMNIRKIGRC